MPRCAHNNLDLDQYQNLVIGETSETPKENIYKCLREAEKKVKTTKTGGGGKGMTTKKKNFFLYIYIF